jgi:hypothetical protein
MGTLREDQYTFLIKSYSVLLRMRKVSGKFVEKVKTQFMFNNLFENRAVCEIRWKNTVESYSLQDDNMVCAHCIFFYF